MTTGEERMLRGGLTDINYADIGSVSENRTRRPASADRTARAANFRRELEAT